MAGGGGHAHADMCALCVCSAGEGRWICRQGSVHRLLPETRPATARKGQRQSWSSSSPEPKGGLQALLQVVTWVSGRAVPYLPTRSAAQLRHFCPRAIHGPFTLETKYHWGTAPRWALTGALRQLTNGKHKRTCNCQCLLWKLLRLFPGRWWQSCPASVNIFILEAVREGVKRGL